MFSGPFILWASRNRQAVRADFCGPDGGPLLSLLADSSGTVVYTPESAEAIFCPGGTPAGNGVIPVNALISLIRTGFPGVPDHWAMMNGVTFSGEGRSVWNFIPVGDTLNPVEDTLSVVLSPDGLFPVTTAGETVLQVSSSSWHDEFNVWPMEWVLESPELGVVMKIRSFDTDIQPPENAFSLVVPVAIDTLCISKGSWSYLEAMPIR